MLQFKRIQVMAFAGSLDSGDPAKFIFALKRIERKFIEYN